MSIVEDKKTIRKKLKAMRNAFTVEQVESSSRAVCEAILTSQIYQQANTILAYLAFGNELNIDSVLSQALADGKRVAVPNIISKTEFEAVLLQNMQDFAYDRYGIRSVPAPVVNVSPEQLDLILVPGVAFGRDGSRMGMGAGYYDRYMAQAPQAIRMGLAYEALLQNNLPCDEYDMKVQYLISESGLRKI